MSNFIHEDKDDICLLLDNSVTYCKTTKEIIVEIPTMISSYKITSKTKKVHYSSDFFIFKRYIEEDKPCIFSTFKLPELITNKFKNIYISSKKERTMLDCSTNKLLFENNLSYRKELILYGGTSTCEYVDMLTGLSLKIMIILDRINHLNAKYKKENLELLQDLMNFANYTNYTKFKLALDILKNKELISYEIIDVGSPSKLIKYTITYTPRATFD